MTIYFSLQKEHFSRIFITKEKVGLIILFLISSFRQVHIVRTIIKDFKGSFGRQNLQDP